MKLRDFFPSLTCGIVASAGAGMIGWSCEVNAAAAPESEPADFIDYAEIETVALSPDGEQVLVETRRADPEANTWTDQFWLIASEEGDEPQTLSLPEGAHSVEWHPDGERLVMIAQSDQESPPQIMAGEPGAETDAFDLLSEADGGVSDFDLDETGEVLAYTTTERSQAEEEDSDREGVVVDVANFSFRELLNDNLTGSQEPAHYRAQLWVQPEGPDSAQPIAEEHHVTRFALSPDGERLALSTREGMQTSGRMQSGEGTDLMIHTLAEDRLETLEEGRDGVDDDPFQGRVTHAAPFWSPSGEQLVFLRYEENFPMVEVPDLGVHDFESGETWFPVKAKDRELSPRRIRWRDEDTILVERIDQARHGLYEVAVESGELTPLRASEDSYHDFSFIDGGERAAWVEQSTARPPEVHIGDPASENVRQVSDFNSRQAELELPEAERVNWTSADGTEVWGWLLKPDNASETEPVPLLTFLNGGPPPAVTNRFSLEQRHIWPYPLTQLVNDGYALLVVHYRGTPSFGRDFREFSLGEKDVEDVHTGVNAIAERDSIDADRLGLLGHSHGATLGPLAGDGGPEFQAASFAEGTGLSFSNYLAHWGFLNVNLQEPVIGGSPWEKPERYLETSPAFQTQLIENTATLIEAGEDAASIEALQFGKAFWRHGTEHEVVIYPETGHNVREPELMLEVMERNLEWFHEHLPL